MVHATKIRYNTTDAGDIEVVLTVEGYNNKRIATRLVAELKGKQITFSAKELKSQRSIEQNSMLWALIHKLSDHINGSHRDEDMMDIYGKLLIRGNIKREYVRVLEKAKHILDENFRAVIEVPNSKRQEANGNVTIGYWVYYGSSKFNVKEMTELIEIALDICSELGLDDSEIETIRRDK